MPVRFDHSNCKHPTSGAEGKKARAKCRKEHAEAANKTSAKKPTTRKRTTAASKVSKPSTVSTKEPVSTVVEDDMDVTADL